MLYVLLFFTTIVAISFAIKYFRQKDDIRLLSESLTNRTSILTHSKEFRGTNAYWRNLVGELNSLIEEISVLDKQSSGRLHQIDTTLGNLQEGVLIIDRDNYILLANSALQKLFPSLRSAVGERVESGLRSAEFLEFIRDAKDKGKGSLRRAMMFSNGMKQIWLEVSASILLEAEEGNAPWYLFVLHDITRLKELEAVRKQFVANASHELKTPVSVIKGYAETLVGDHVAMSSGDRERFLKTIHRHAERLALLINDLLSLSRLESEEPSLDWAEVDLFAWLRDFHRESCAGGSGDKRKVTLVLPEVGQAIATFDGSKLRQVMDNLVENARKYTPSSGTIEVGANRLDQEVEVWVSDEGPGVPERDLSRIFERFYRVDKGRSRETGGTGLGLSIVKHIVEWHEGTVWAENVPDRGLRVVWRIPLVESHLSEIVV